MTRPAATSASTSTSAGREFNPDLHGVRSTLAASWDERAALAGEVLSPGDAAAATSFWRAWPDYRPSPLIPLPQLAAALRLASLDVKHEGERFGVGSFKTLGPPYALARALADVVARRQAGAAPTWEELFAGRHAEAAKSTIACAATSGNHGRALAWAAQRLQCGCRIYMPESVSRHREQAIRAFGVETVRIPGNFDDAQARAVADATNCGWLRIGGEPVSARRILHGYSQLASELIDVWQNPPQPTHVFIPAGSGLLAAAIAGRLLMEYGNRMPRIIVAQPHAANSLLPSLAAQQHGAAEGDLITMMDGLSVRRPQEDAWTILRVAAFGAVSISDEVACRTLRLISRPGDHDLALQVGETGIAAVAALAAVATCDDARELFEVDANSHCVAVATEGISDPEIVRSILARFGDD